MPLHKLSVAVTNTGPVTILVEELQLVSDSFETVPFRRWDMPLGRTPRTDLSIPYGPARCDPEKIPPAKPATVVMRMRAGDGPSREVRFPIPATDPLLTRLVHTECASYILSQAVEVAFGPAWTRDGDRLRGVLTVKRRSATGPVTIDDLLGTTHYRLEPVSGRRHPVAVLTGPSLEIPALVTPTRCDPHAFAESKQAVLFSIQAAATEGGEIYNMMVVPPTALGLEFQNYAVDVCDLPT
ncbi:hypothetical protein [Acrocarpospora catenulata]|uniref:hypothetical protein n=1 Tax=Acrocarpospora catenulata TaxID=2836182 RepID=UPI001BDAE36D|nr:hypothetical protein [Acrocarpospora catenulata]